MSKQGISTGTAPNDGSGDSLLAGAIKINNNFDEIYSTFGDGSSLSYPNYVENSGVSTYSTSAGISSLSDLATLADTATVAEGLTGNPNIQVSDLFANYVTAISFTGDGSNLTGVGASVTIYDDQNLIGSVANIDFNGNLYVSEASSGIVTVTVPGFGRSEFTTPTGVLGIGQTLSFSFNAFKSYAFLKAESSAPCRVIVYTDPSSQILDEGRPSNVSPTPNSGIVTDLVGISTATYLLPPPIGYNAEDPLIDWCYVTLENLSGVSTDITLKLTFLQME